MWHAKPTSAKASEILEEGLTYTRRVGYLFWEVRLETYRAQVALLSGEPERAKEIIGEIGEQNLKEFALAGAEASGVLGHTYLRQGELIESEKYFLGHLPILQRARDWQLLTWYYCGLGQLYLQKGEDITAEEQLRKGYELFKEIGVAAFWAARLF